MKRKLTQLALFLTMAISVSASTYGNTGVPNIGIDEKLGGKIPLELKFRDEDGKMVKLGDVLQHHPTVLSLVYFNCPGICTPLLKGEADVIREMSEMRPGKDFNLVTVSFNPKDTPELAQMKRDNHIRLASSEEYRLKADQWRFLTGSADSIDKLTEAVGFNYRKQGSNDFVHSATLIIISPKGKIVRYLPGTEYNKFDVEMAVTEAGLERVGPTIRALGSRVKLFCFSYDPEGRTYVVQTTRIALAVSLVFSVCLLAVLGIIVRKRSKGTQEG